MGAWPVFEVLTVPETAARLRVASKSVYGLIRAGKLQAVHVGRAIRVTVSALDEFLAAKPQPRIFGREPSGPEAIVPLPPSAKISAPSIGQPRTATELRYEAHLEEARQDNPAGGTGSAE